MLLTRASPDAVIVWISTAAVLIAVTAWRVLPAEPVTEIRLPRKETAAPVAAVAVTQEVKKKDAPWWLLVVLGIVLLLASDSCTAATVANCHAV